MLRPNARLTTCKTRTSSIDILRFVVEARARIALQRNKKAVGQWMRLKLIDMGPAFIKFGQFLSTRPDFVDKDVVKELSRLQDEITEVPFDQVKFTLEEAYGSDTLYTIFSSIEPNAIASASIGQVHRAKLINDKTVILKIQKPCVAEAISNDLATLRILNKYLGWVDPMRKKEFDSILDQYDMFLSAELDYMKEMVHMENFRKALVDLDVRIPRVYKNLCRPSVLVMEYVPSTKITDVEALSSKNFDRSMIATNVVQIFLYQFVKSGLIHCDPHPGNIGVMPNGKTIVLYDFGNVIKLDENFRAKIKNLVFAVYQKDVDEFVDLLVELKILNLNDDMDALEIKAFFGYFFNYLETLDTNTLRTSILTNDLMKESNMNVKLDTNFMSLVRVFTLLDGTCVLLDPKFNYLDALAPYTMEIMTDFTFFDYRARKDLTKLRDYTSLARTTDQNILRLNQRMKNASQDLINLRVITLAMCLMDAIQNTEQIIYILPVVVLVLASGIIKQR